MKKKWFIIISLICILCFFGIYMKPENRVERFVNRYSEEIEGGLENGNGISASIKMEYFNTWFGEHDMLEIRLFTWGNTYYGCYYSRDDVPLPFQNSGVGLMPQSQDSWTWKGKGDNQGATYKIKNHWYYYEASF